MRAGIAQAVVALEFRRPGVYKGGSLTPRKTVTASSRSPISLFRDPEFVALASARFVRGLSFATIIIALALYADEYAASGVVAGLFGTAYALSRLLFVLPVGRAIDVGGGKRYLVAGLAVNALLLVGYMQIGAIEHVVLLRALQGGGSALLVVTTTTVIGEVAPTEERGLWIGTSGQVKSVASLAGDLGGGALLYLYGFQTTYTVLIGVTAIATLLVILFVRRDPGVRTDADERTGIETYRRLLSQNAVRALVFFRLAFSFGKMAVIIFLPIFARTEFGMTSFAIGGILAGGRVTKALAQGYTGSVGDRMGNRSWFVLSGAGVYALGTALIPLAAVVSGIADPLSLAGFGRRLTVDPVWLWLFGCYVVLGIADSLRIPASVSMFVEEGEHYDAVAGSVSLRSVSWQLGAALGPFVVGGVIDYASVFAAFWLATVLVCAAGGIFAVLYTPDLDPIAAVSRRV
jgi:MFS family permease